MLTNSLHNHFRTLREQGKKITLVTGVFDLLHQEHRTFLEKARKIGDVLVVGIESDVRVRQMKGESRPIQVQAIRKDQIEEMKLADTIFILPENCVTAEDYDQLIAEMLPSFLAVSSHSPYLESKQRIMSKYGGELKIVHEFNPEISTTILEKKLAHT